MANVQKIDTPIPKLEKHDDPPKRTHTMHTRALSTCASRNAVWQTPELLHAILIELPIKDLIAFRGVSLHWNEMIMTSRPILKVMFLAPVPQPKPFEWVTNPACGTIKIADIKKPKPDPIRGNVYMSTPTVLNPYLFKLGPANTRPDLVTRASLCEPVQFRVAPNININLLKAGSPKLVYNMYLTQPPVATMVAYISLTPTKRNKHKRHPHCPMPFRVTVTAADGYPGVRLVDLLLAIVNNVGWAGRAQCKINLAVNHGRPETVLWMVGAVFASDQEKILVKNGHFADDEDEDHGDGGNH